MKNKIQMFSILSILIISLLPTSQVNAAERPIGGINNPSFIPYMGSWTMNQFTMSWGDSKDSSSAAKGLATYGTIEQTVSINSNSISSISIYYKGGPLKMEMFYSSTTKLAYCYPQSSTVWYQCSASDIPANTYLTKVKFTVQVANTLLDLVQVWEEYFAAPSVPRDFQSGLDYDGNVVLVWNSPTSVGTGSNLDYVIQRLDPGTGQYWDLAYTSNEFYVDTLVNQDSNYYYRIYARTSDGTSTFVYHSTETCAANYNWYRSEALSRTDATWDIEISLTIEIPGFDDITVLIIDVEDPSMDYLAETFARVGSYADMYTKNPDDLVWTSTATWVALYVALIRTGLHFYPIVDTILDLISEAIVAAAKVANPVIGLLIDALEYFGVTEDIVPTVREIIELIIVHTLDGVISEIASIEPLINKDPFINQVRPQIVGLVDDIFDYSVTDTNILNARLGDVGNSIHDTSIWAYMAYDLEGGYSNCFVDTIEHLIPDGSILERDQLLNSFNQFQYSVNSPNFQIGFDEFLTYEQVTIAQSSYDLLNSQSTIGNILTDNSFLVIPNYNGFYVTVFSDNEMNAPILDFTNSESRMDWALNVLSGNYLSIVDSTAEKDWMSSVMHGFAEAMALLFNADYSYFPPA